MRGPYIVSSTVLLIDFYPSHATREFLYLSFFLCIITFICTASTLGGRDPRSRYSRWSAMVIPSFGSTVSFIRYNRQQQALKPVNPCF